MNKNLKDEKTIFINYKKNEQHIRRNLLTSGDSTRECESKAAELDGQMSCKLHCTSIRTEEALCPECNRI